MELKPLKVQVREGSGKGASRRVRTGGNIPAVVYGEGKDPLAITIELRAFDQIIHGKSGENAVVQLDVEGDKGLSGPAMIKSVQHHPLRNTVTHADLLRINLKEKIRIAVPIEIVGRAQGIIEGGVPDQQLYELEVECLALEVPEKFEADVTNVGMNGTFHVSDVAIPEGVTLMTDGDLAIFSVHPPRVTAEKEETAAEGEAAPAAPAAG